MRLLNTSTLEVESVGDTEKPPYAILSHTWELEGEVLYEDLRSTSKKEYQSKSGYSKVRNTCYRALSDGYKYVWIDTCCIDKSSSAELSEAINSMFRWYQESSICYAFFSDVADGEALSPTSNWFGRGWTLQELIAPNRVVFLNASWQVLGDREKLADEISVATWIERRMLVRPDCKVQDVLCSFSVAQRMKWASKRVTSRVEDIAYCLMGLFDVNMPLLYGEGAYKAFRRLQEAIISEGADQSILAFREPGAKPRFHSAFSPVLAPSVRCFCDDIQHEWALSSEVHQRISNIRLLDGNVMMRVYLANLSVAKDGVVNPYAPSHIAYLDCVFEDDYLSRPALLLRQVSPNGINIPLVFRRCSAAPILLKATIKGLVENTVVMGDNTAFKISTNFPAQRKEIKIETERHHQHLRSLPGHPITLDFSALKDYCTIGPSHPPLQSNDWHLTAYNFIGAVTLKYESELFLVFWGNDPGAWSCIQTLESLRFAGDLAIGSELNDEDAAGAVVQHIRENETRVRELMSIFITFPSVWGPSNWHGPPQFVVGLVDRLAVSRSCTVVKFIGREVPRMELTAKYLPEERSISPYRLAR